jgi:monoamine oxidase
LPLGAGAREAILARIEVSTAYPASDQDAAVLEESGTSLGRYPTHSVAGGNQSVAQALAARLGGSVKLATPVQRISWQPGKEITVTAGGTETVADRAVVAVPASVCRKVVFDPPLPPAKAGALSAVRYGHAAKLFLPLDAEADPSATLCVPQRYWTFTQREPEGGRLPVAASFAGTEGALERLAIAEGPATWAASVQDLRPDLALRPAEAVLSTWSTDPWILAAYSARSRTSPLDDAALAAAVGPLHFAGEHTAGEWHAQMEGALRSGERVAAEILATATEP